MLGIESLDENDLVFRITAEVEAGKQYEIQREIRKQIKLLFDENDFEKVQE